MTPSEVVLESARLELRPFHPRDAAELHALFLDADVARHLLDGERVPRSWVEDEITGSRDRFETLGCGLWSVRRAGESPIIGIVGYRYFFDPPELELLYALLPSAWGAGFATEAAEAVTAYAFDRLDFAVVRAAVDEPNTASIRVLERLDMSQWKAEGDAPDRTLFYEVDAEAWAMRP